MSPMMQFIEVGRMVVYYLVMGAGVISLVVNGYKLLAYKNR